MKTLTIKQPWADAIVYGTKRTENRTWSTRYRGRLLIHAGGSYDQIARYVIPAEDRADWPDTRKALIGLATFTDVHPAAGGCCAPWGESGAGVYHWTLTDVVTLAEPVACPGRLGLWIPPGELLHQTVRQVGLASATEGRR